MSVRSEGCTTLLLEGLVNINTWKSMLNHHCYIPSCPAQMFTIQSQNNVSKSLAEGINPINTHLQEVDTRQTSSGVCFSYGGFFKQTPSILTTRYEMKRTHQNIHRNSLVFIMSIKNLCFNIETIKHVSEFS